MSHDDQIDAALQRQFDTLRAHDRAQTPDFVTMAARARQTVDAAPLPARDQAPIAPAPVLDRGWTASPWAWGLPALAAAGLAAVMLVPRQGAADREFEALVADWSRTSAATMRAPTDGLLAVPGSEYLRSTPSLSQPLTGTPATRAPSPSLSRPRSPS